MCFPIRLWGGANPMMSAARSWLAALGYRHYVQRIVAAVPFP